MQKTRFTKGLWVHIPYLINYVYMYSSYKKKCPTMSQFCVPHGRSVAIIYAKLWYNQFNIITIRAHKFSKNLNYETIKLLRNRSLCLCCLYYFWPPPSSRCQQVSKKLSIRVDCSIWWGIFWHLHKNFLASCSTWKFCDSYCSTAHKVSIPNSLQLYSPQ